MATNHISMELVQSAIASIEPDAAAAAAAAALVSLPQPSAAVGQSPACVQ
jgi:hypothetical protein